MNKPKAHVSEVKKKEVEILKKLLEENEIVGILDLTNLPSAQFQKLKNKLKDTISIRVSKKSLIKLAIESSKENKKGLEKLEEYLLNCMPALLTSNEDPFKIAKKLNRNKSNLAAKPGQISPIDIEIPEGPTSFPAGPVVGELGAAGIKAAIENGKVVIKQAKIIVKTGDVIDQKAADLLSKFNIEPMEIGLNLVAVYQNGEILNKEVLSIDEAKVLGDIKTIYNEALNLAVFVGYPTKDTVEILLKKAEAESIALSKKVLEEKPTEERKEDTTEEIKKVEEPNNEENSKTKLESTEEKPIEESSDEKKEEISQSENQSDKTEQKGPSDYNEEDAKKAQEVLNQMKDNHGG
jgi:large subunit ribosomal protein L10